MAPKDTKYTEKDITNANFKGKKERNVPDKGIRIKLKELSEPISYGLGASTIEYDGIHKYIRITDIDDITGEYNNRYVSPSYFDNNYLLVENDILFARTGASVGKTYFHTSNNNVYYAGFLMRVRITNHDPFYIYQQFKTQRFKKWLSVMSIRSGQPGINSKELGNYNVFIDTYENECRIANILRKLDTRILTQKKIIEDILCLRSSICNNFCHYKGEKYKIMDIAEIGRGRVINSTEISQQNNPKYPVYSSQTLNNGIMGYLDDYDFDGEYITWTTDGANAGTVFYHNEKFNCTNVCGTLKITSSYVNPFYLSLILESACKKYVSSNLANPKLMNNTMATISIIIPNEIIQFKSSNLVKSLDAKISNEKRILELYQKQKDYLLNKMFI